MSSNCLARIFLIFALLATWNAVVEATLISQEVYTETSTVKKYRLQAWSEYVKTPADFNQIASIVYYRSGPIVVIGFLAFVILMFWSCCRTCQCCNCQQPRREDENANKWTPRIFTFLMLCLFGATAGLMLNGFSVLNQQKDTLQNIPNLMDNLISYIDTSIDCSNDFRTELNATAMSLRNITSCASTPSCNSSVTELESSSARVNDVVSNEKNARDQVQKNRAVVQMDIDLSKEYLELFMIVALSVLCFLVCVQGLIAIFNSWCPRKYQPRKMKFLLWLWGLFTFIALIVILVLFIFSALLIFFTTVFADFCVNPIENAMLKSNIKANSTTSYYLLCQQGAGLNASLNPINAELDNAIANYSGANNSLHTISCVNDFDCNNSVSNATFHFNKAFVSLSKLRDQTKCVPVNGFVQAAARVVCVSFMDSLASTFEIFMAFVSFLLLVEIFRRRFPIRYEDEEPAPNNGLPPPAFFQNNPHFNESGPSGLSTFNGSLEKGMVLNNFGSYDSNSDTQRGPLQESRFRPDTDQSHLEEYNRGKKDPLPPLPVTDTVSGSRFHPNVSKNSERPPSYNESFPAPEYNLGQNSRDSASEYNMGLGGVRPAAPLPDEIRSSVSGYYAQSGEMYLNGSEP